MKGFVKPGLWFTSFVLMLSLVGSLSMAGESSAKSNLVKHVETTDYKKEVLNSKVPVFVDFHAVWCKPCKMLSPTVEALAEQYKGKVKFVKVDIDKAPEIANMYSVRAVPTMVIINNGKKVSSIMGFQSKDRVDSFLTKNIKGLK